MLALLDTRSSAVVQPQVYSIGLEAPGRAFIHAYEQQSLEAGQFRVTTRYSGISSSEVALIGGAARRNFSWNPVRYTEAKQPYPILSLGHMEVGWVSASRSSHIREGQWVALAYGHKTAHTVQTPEDFYVELGGLASILGIFLAQVGPGCAYRLLQASQGHTASDLRKLKGKTVGIAGDHGEAVLCALMARHFGGEVRFVSHGRACRQAASALGLDAEGPSADRPQIWVDFGSQSSNPRASAASWNPWRSANRQDLVEVTLELLHHHGAAIKQHLITHCLPASQGLGFLQNLGACEQVVQAVLEYPLHTH